MGDEEGCDSRTEELRFGKEENGGGDAGRFPFRFKLEEETCLGGSESASDVSEFLEDTE